ncbi:MAG: AMP-binding protein [Planctomycetia bacterium]|nr:AMP-binding protein [Planctomycetia bacterium]
MTNLAIPPGTIASTAGVNVARRLTTMAARMPEALSVVVPRGRESNGKRKYDTFTFRQLDEDSNRIASGLRQMGVDPGARIALLVRPSMEFISLVFALFKAGAVIVLVDPGMGRKNLIRCLADAQPEGFVAIPLVHVARTLLKRKFPRARFNVTIGRRLFWDGLTLDEVRQRGQSSPVCHEMSGHDPAAIIFTTGSTGPPKGVLYRHGNFDRQVGELGDFYGIQPGEIDLPGFPLFGLFNCALGVTTVIPDMDPSRPARVDPRKIVEAIHDWNVTQAFGSPAIWNRVGQYCHGQHIQLPTLRRVLSAGAPVPPHVLARMKECIAVDGDVHTPYGATESLPVASIAATEVLGETRRLWAQGAGTCIGRKFPSIEWKVIEIVDGPIPTLSHAVELPSGRIGELIVSGPVVTREYVTRTEANALGKIVDGTRVWHRMGDVGYLDDQARFWFCGRMAHRVVTASGVMFTIPCEALFNQHPAIYRSALVGIGEPGRQRPVIIAEPWPGKMPRGKVARQQLLSELKQLSLDNALTRSIHDFLLHPAMPVDIRHNAKIFREKLAVWAARKLR